MFKHSIPVHWLVIVMGILSVFFLSATKPADAQADYGPDTCVTGFVWREAFGGDHICVTPETRTQTARDNRSTPLHREPNGGPYDPDTCVQGFVWREANPEDHVCVTPEVREQAAVDNRLASSRKLSKRNNLDRPIRSDSSSQCSTSPEGTPKVYLLPDGNIEYQYPNGIKQQELGGSEIIICPDGSRTSRKFQFLFQDAIRPLPPDLPNEIQTEIDPWLEDHNKILLTVIESLAQNRADAVKYYLNREGGGTVYSQIEKRTKFIGRMIEKLSR